MGRLGEREGEGEGEKREDGGGEKSICKFVLGGQWEGDLREGSDFG